MPNSVVATASQITEEKLSVCPLDCPDTCSLKVSVTDNQITKVRGSKVNPLTQGSICTKVSRFYPDFVHGPRRLRHPMRRTGPKGSGEFQPISWDEALNSIYNNMQPAIERYGSETVMPLNYAGPHGKLAGGSMDVRFFNQLGASRLNRSPLCGGVRAMAYQSLYGSTTPGMPPQQAEQSDLIIIWGCNVSVANLHFMRTIKQARANGAKLIVIDPRRTQVARQADLFIQITPGTDVTLAMYLTARLTDAGLLNEQAESLTSGLDAYLTNARSYLDADLATICSSGNQQITEQTETFIDFIREAESICVNVGVGLERTRNGGAACRAAYSFPLLFGKTVAAGNGVIGSYGSLYPKNNQLTASETDNSADKREFNIIEVSDHLLDKTATTPVSCVFIYNHNPVATHPDQAKLIRALSQEDLFVVGCDVEMNDSMLYADILLPAATHFEHEDVFSAYGHGYLQRAEAVISPVGEALPNTEIFRRLAARFGFTDPCFQDSDQQLQDQAFNLNQADHGVNSANELATDQVITLQTPDSRWLSNPQLTTPSSKAELYSATLEDAYQAGLPTYQASDRTAPFQLISPASDKRTNATFGGHEASSNIQLLEINPADAEQLAVSDKDLLLISNSLGEVQVRAKVTDAVAPGVVCCEKGAWCKTSSTGLTVNALISNSSKTDIGDGAAYYDTYVSITRCL